MKFSLRSFYLILLSLAILKFIVFATIIPIWHTPDEQAHFAQVAFFAEKGRMPFRSEFDLNKEIYISEQLLETDRNESGNNKFTFNPSYKMEYTETLIGKREPELQTIPTSERKELIKYESANYPPLYYEVSVLFYKVFYSFGIIDRVYAVRALGLLITVGLFIIAWKLSKELFSENLIFRITFISLIIFHPMFSFVLAGVNSDNLFNLLFSLVIYLGVLIIKYGIKLKYIFSILFVLYLSYLTKPQFILAIPVFLCSLTVVFLTSKVKIIHKALILLLFILAGLLMLVLSTNREFYIFIQGVYPQNFYPFFLGKRVDLSFIQFFRNTLDHTLHEVLPWYWGVYKWLSVVYPIEVTRILNRLVLLSVLGITIKLLVSLIRKNKKDWVLYFMIFVPISYFLGVTIYNYIFTLSHGYSFGIQGRYYFPLMMAQMALLLWGVTALVPTRFRNYIALLLGLGMISLNIFSLYVISNSYYDLTNFNTFIVQVSQYKPGILKGNMIVGILFAYLLTLVTFVLLYSKINLRKKLVKD